MWKLETLKCVFKDEKKLKTKTLLLQNKPYTTLILQTKQAIFSSLLLILFLNNKPHIQSQCFFALYFMCIVVLSACIFYTNMFWEPWERHQTPWDWLWMVVSLHESAGNWTQLLLKPMNHLSSHNVLFFFLSYPKVLFGSLLRATYTNQNYHIPINLKEINLILIILLIF